MTLGALHEFIIDCFTCERIEPAVVSIKTRMYQKGFDVFYTHDSLTPNYTTDTIRADLWIVPLGEEEGFPLEVGKMKVGKWGDMRCLRVDFDGSVWFLNPKGTPFEHELLLAISKSMPSYIAEFKKLEATPCPA